MKVEGYSPTFGEPPEKSEKKPGENADGVLGERVFH
jgi:hypothetical protein